MIGMLAQWNLGSRSPFVLTNIAGSSGRSGARRGSSELAPTIFQNAIEAIYLAAVLFRSIRQANFLRYFPDTAGWSNEEGL